MKISSRGILISLQLDDEGKEILRRADVPAETALAAYVVDEDERGLWIRIEPERGKYWLLLRWSIIKSVEIPVPAPKEAGIR